MNEVTNVIVTAISQAQAGSGLEIKLVIVDWGRIIGIGAAFVTMIPVVGIFIKMALRKGGQND